MNIIALSIQQPTKEPTVGSHFDKGYLDANQERIEELERNLGVESKTDARRFVEFVLRHTLPARARAHGAEAVHSIIKHHPFAQANGSLQATSKDGSDG